MVWAAKKKEPPKLDTSSEKLKYLLSPAWNKFIRHHPTPKQTAFLLLPHKEAFYGGAAGGGKSDALLMAALQYIQYPGYAAILFRRSFSDLALPGALLERAFNWLSQVGQARWVERDKRWQFGRGGSLSFGYLDGPRDHFRYQSAEFQFIGFDELTQFDAKQYLYLFSRLRRLKGVTIPPRVRAASNPGGIGHSWVKQRFVDPGSEGVPFIRATLKDNPFLDQEDYKQQLSKLDHITRAQLQFGRWDVSDLGGLFKGEWFSLVDEIPHTYNAVRYWDLAGTEPTEKKPDPDYTAGCLMKYLDPYFFIDDMKELRGRPKAVEDLVLHTAQLDGVEIPIVIEEEPGASGKSMVDYFSRLLPGHTVKGDRPTGPKYVRAQPFSSKAEAGYVKLRKAPWNRKFLEEAEAFDGEGKIHDDKVDAATGAFKYLTSALPVQVFL